MRGLFSRRLRSNRSHLTDMTARKPQNMIGPRKLSNHHAEWNTAMKQALESPSRRQLLRNVTGASVAVLGGSERSSGEAEDSEPKPTYATAAPSGKKFVAVQVGAVSFVDEGVEQVLDILQKRGGVNALMLAVFTCGRGIAGRQIPGQPLPDHGAQTYDTDTFHGGSYTAVHPQFFQNSIFKDFRAPDVGAFDLLAEVVPKESARHGELLLVRGRV